ncbi:hypothetical protein ABK040_001400 [Willaertia magna]
MAPSTTTSSSGSSSSDASMVQVISTLLNNYSNKTSQRVKLIDQFIVLSILIAIIQFVYCQVVGTFPFNSMLAGFFCCICCMVFAVSLRKQVNNDTRFEFKSIVIEKSISDFIIISILLFLACVTYLG